MRLYQLPIQSCESLSGRANKAISKEPSEVQQPNLHMRIMTNSQHFEIAVNEWVNAQVTKEVASSSRVATILFGKKCHRYAWWQRKRLTDQHSRGFYLSKVLKRCAVSKKSKNKSIHAREKQQEKVKTRLSYAPNDC